MAESGQLHVDGLHVSYGLSKALSDVSVTVEAGSVLAVLGPNGAGKSTLGRAISGLVPCAAGAIRFGDDQINGWPAHRVARSGLIYIPEGRGIFPGLSVLENLKMATRSVGGRQERREAVDLATDLFPVLGTRAAQRAGTLSGGEQQMLALARALAVRPRLIIADEMSLGLAPQLVEQVFEALQRAKQMGITIMLIEQFIHRALGFADSCVILTRGAVGWHGPAADAGAEVLNQYLGEASPSDVGKTG